MLLAYSLNVANDAKSALFEAEMEGYDRPNLYKTWLCEKAFAQGILLKRMWLTSPCIALLLHT